MITKGKIVEYWNDDAIKRRLESPAPCVACRDDLLPLDSWGREVAPYVVDCPKGCLCECHTHNPYYKLVR